MKRYSEIQCYWPDGTVTSDVIGRNGIDTIGITNEDTIILTGYEDGRHQKLVMKPLAYKLTEYWNGQDTSV